MVHRLQLSSYILNYVAPNVSKSEKFEFSSLDIEEIYEFV